MKMQMASCEERGEPFCDFLLAVRWAPPEKVFYAKRVAPEDE